MSRSSTNPEPSTHDNLQSFFQTEVLRTASDLGTSAPAETQIYLAGLLSRYSRTDTAFPQQPDADGRYNEEPLAFILKRALEADEHERVRVLKRLGDVALYTSGLFAERIEQQGMDVRYYIEMGGMAYSNVSSLSSKGHRLRQLGELYEGLARHFTDLVDVLWELADRTRMSSDGGLLELYRRWERTQSDRLARKLTSQGFILDTNHSLN